MSRLPAAKRREQLLDCAAALFAEHGYARATTAQLARAAGVTEPIIYRHFRSKRDLFVALIERTGEDTIAQWESDLADASDAMERIRRLLADNPMVHPTGASAYRVILQAITEVDDEAIHAAVARHMGLLHGFVQRELERGRELGAVTDRVPTALMGWMLIDMALGFGVASALRIPGHSAAGMGGEVQRVISAMLFRPGRRGADAGRSAGTLERDGERA